MKCRNAQVSRPPILLFTNQSYNFRSDSLQWHDRDNNNGDGLNKKLNDAAAASKYYIEQIFCSTVGRGSRTLGQCDQIGLILNGSFCAKVAKTFGNNFWGYFDKCCVISWIYYCSYLLEKWATFYWNYIWSHWSPVWPDWADFEWSLWQTFMQKWLKYLATTFWATLTNVAKIS